MLGVTPVVGQTRWTLGGSGNWSTAGNWSGGVPTATTDTFFTNATGNIAIDLAGAARTAQSLTFGSNANYTLNNQTLTLSTSSTGLVQNGSGTITINSAVALGVNKAFVGNGSGTVTMNGVVSGARVLTKAGSFTLTLTNANTYSGGTVLNSGYLIAQGNNAALGTGGVTLNGGTNQINGLTIGNNVTFSGGALQTIGAVASSLFGITTMTSNGTVITDTDLTLGNANNELTGAGQLIKEGAEKLIINMANNLTGGIRVNTGTLVLNNNRAAGTGTLTFDGGNLTSSGTRSLANALSVLTSSYFIVTNGNDLTFTSSTISSTAGQSLTFTNTGAGTSILGFSGSGFTYAGDINLAGGNATQMGFQNAAGIQTFSGAISGAGSLNKTAAGTVILSGNNTFSGGTTIAAGGDTIASSATAFGSPGNVTINNASTISLRGTNVYINNLTATAATTVRINEAVAGGTTSRALIVAGTVSGAGGVILGDSVNSTANPVLILTSTSATHTAALNLDGNTAGTNPGDLVFSNASGIQTYSGVISSGGRVMKMNDGTSVLNAANTYSGQTIIGLGVLNIRNNTSLGSGANSIATGTTVSNGGALEIQGGITVANELLTLNGTGPAANGALRNISGNNTWSGDINLLSASSVISDLNQLTIGENTTYLDTLSNNTFAITLGGAGDIFLNASLSGSGDVTKTGTGTLTLYANTNYNTGTFRANDGLTVLDTLQNLNGAIKGDIVIGDGIGAASSAQIRWGSAAGPAANEMVINTSAVTVNSDGWLNLNSQVETIGSLTMAGGLVTMNNGAALGTLTVNGNITGNASATTSIISNGTLNLGSAVRTFSIADGAAAVDMTINSVISNGGLTKTNAGTLLLGGATANTYASGTIVSGGTLQLGKTAGVNAIAGNLAVSNATVELINANQIANTSAVALFNSTFDVNGVNETVSSFTLSGSTNYFDFGTGASQFNAGAASLGSGIFNIYNWSGSATQTGGTDQFRMTVNAGAFTNQIFFYSDNGITLAGNGQVVSASLGGGFFELIPIPEPTPTPFIIGLAFVLLFLRKFRRPNL
ncbi:MAG: autotransporter-associated beta strand repeat-containing protein [Verrucomicrobiota bacterium]|nr:autotransporter-associated beta strand repeat-containing protein [Verrucomicrobiota bacterium]